MNTVLLLSALVAACVGAPQYSSSASIPSRYTLPSGSSSSSSSSSSSGGSRSTRGPVVAIVRDDRVNPEGGSYSFNLETADGISRQESGSPVPTQDGGVVSAMSGEYSFTLPDGQLFTMKYVADENGFQAQSPFLPVAPAFPHPIPAHALEQIEFARQQRERGVSPGTGRYNPPAATPAPSYRAPTPSPTYRTP